MSVRFPEIGLELMGFEKRGKLDSPEKTSQNKAENQQKTQPTYSLDAECSSHCATLFSRLHSSLDISLITPTLLCEYFPLHGNTYL